MHVAAAIGPVLAEPTALVARAILGEALALGLRGFGWQKRDLSLWPGGQDTAHDSGGGDGHDNYGRREQS